jgi:hypothetical protein
LARQLDVDASGAAHYSTAPPLAQAAPQRWTHHWRQCVAFLPGAGVPLRAGQRLTLRASHDDHSIWFHVHASPPDADSADADADAPPLPMALSRPPPDAAHAARLGSRERVWQLNDERYACALRGGAAAALAAARPAGDGDDAARSPLRVAVLGDGPLLPRIAAALPRAAAVTALVSTPEQLVVVARAASAAASAAASSSSSSSHAPPVHAAAPVRAALASRFLRGADDGEMNGGACGGVFDVALAEPYYALLDTCALPWAPACRLWRELSALRARGALARGAPVAPARATLHARLVALPALAASRAAVGDVCGVDVSRANALLRPPCAAASEQDEQQAEQQAEQALAGAFPVQLFQVAAGGLRLLSDPVQLTALDFATSDWAPRAGAAEARARADGHADALLLWVSYEYDGGSAGVSGAPRTRPDDDNRDNRDDHGAALAPGFERQAVALLRRRMRVAAGDVARVAWALDETLSLRVSFERGSDR